MSATSTHNGTINGIRTALGIAGGLALILGVLILVWPGKTAMVATALIAIYAVAAGLVYLGLGIFSRVKTGWSRVGNIVLGLVFIIAGVVAIANLFAATAWMGVFIGLFLGITWIVEGVVAFATISGARSRGWTIFFAIVSILAGIVLLFTPLWGATVLWLLVGISGIVLGVLNIVRAFTFGR